MVASATPDVLREPTHVTSEVRAAIADFLFEEAAALDEGRYQDWLDLLTEDYEYRVPMPYIKDGSPFELYHESAMLAWGSKGFFSLRFARVQNDKAWSDRPRPYGRHLVTNIRVSQRSLNDEWNVRSYVLFTRSRADMPLTVLSGLREDVIRGSIESGFQLANRVVYIDVEAPLHEQMMMPL